MTRGEAIAAKCRECVADDQAAGTWREQVSACSCIGCPLWRYRPPPRSAPAWLVSHRADDLPGGFASLSHDDAIVEVRRETDAKASGAPVRPQNRPCRAGDGATPPEPQGITGCARTASRRQ